MSLFIVRTESDPGSQNFKKRERHQFKADSMVSLKWFQQHLTLRTNARTTARRRKDLLPKKRRRVALVNDGNGKNFFTKKLAFLYKIAKTVEKRFYVLSA